MPRLTGSFRVRRLCAVLAAIVLGISTASGGDDAGRLRAESPDRMASLSVRGFYMPSYDVNGFRAHASWRNRLRCPRDPNVAATAWLPLPGPSALRPARNVCR